MTDIPKAKTASWAVLGMLAAAQFIMVLDTAVMNVSISQIVEDLNTTVVGLQTAITCYTLVGSFQSAMLALVCARHLPVSLGANLPDGVSP